MQFEYKKVPSSPDPQDPWIILPMLKIRLSHDTKTVQLDALVDSGATVSLFNRVVAEKLGIDYQSGLKQQYFGISGHDVDTYFHKVKLQIVGADESLNIAVGFTDSLGVGALLGQADFFQAYKITFERYKERMEIKPAKQ
jgi:hypothetical protein